MQMISGGFFITEADPNSELTLEQRLRTNNKSPKKCSLFYIIER